MSDYILSLSYGKDSIACLEAIKILGLPLDRIVHVEVWATNSIPADLPSMVDFKVYADKIIKNRYGLTVEHVKADVTYEEQFYKLRFNKKLGQSIIYGFPCIAGAWCNSKLKVSALNKCNNKNSINYVGIAIDEPRRFHCLNDNIISPLVKIGWTEKQCYEWCSENKLLSPIYKTSARGGCWFCHNQSIEQLRLLRKNYPDYWRLLLKWDYDSPVTFSPKGITVHDYEKRFFLEDLKCLPIDKSFRWKMLHQDLQISLF